MKLNGSGVANVFENFRMKSRKAEARKYKKKKQDTEVEIIPKLEDVKDQPEGEEKLESKLDSSVEIASTEPKKELSDTVENLEHKKALLENQLEILQNELKTLQTTKEQTLQIMNEKIPGECAPLQSITLVPQKSKRERANFLEIGKKGRSLSKRSSMNDKFDSEDDEDEYLDDYDSTPLKKRGRKIGGPNVTSKGRKIVPTARAKRASAGRKRNQFDEDEGEEDENGSDLEACTELLHYLMKQQNSWPFNEPVDPVKLGILDYFDVIKHPMDLRTIKENLEAGDYQTSEEFANDVRLVWSNATTYNPSNHLVHKWAQSLSSIFEKKFAKLKPKPLIKRPPKSVSPSVDRVVPFASEPTSPPSVPVVTNISPSSHTPVSEREMKIKDQMKSTIDELRDSMKSVREEIMSLRREKQIGSPQVPSLVAPPPPSYKGPGRPPGSTNKNRKNKILATSREDSKEMTFEEKKELSESINILPAENLGKVVQIIHQKMPNLAQNVLDEIEIDIDALDGSTLRHLQRYIKSVLHKQPRKKRGISSKQSTEVSNKSINEVKQKLRDLTEKSSVFSKSGLGKNGEENDDVDVDDGEHKTYPTVLIEKEKRSSSSSSSSDSSTSSDSGSSSSSSSESDSNKKKKDKRSKLVKMEGANLSDEKSKNLGLANTILSVPVVAHSKNPSNSDKGPFQESKDDALSSPVEKKPEEITSTQLEEPPAILQTTTQLKVNVSCI